jgi:hypothetical protein
MGRLRGFARQFGSLTISNCHSRESGHPGGEVVRWRLDSRFRGNDEFRATSESAGKARLRNDHGVALISVFVLATLLLSLTLTLSVNLESDTKLRGAFGHRIEGFYAAEAGLNRGIGDYESILLDFDLPSGADLDEQTFTIGGRNTVYQLNPKLGVQSICAYGASPCPTEATIPLGDVFGGLHAIERGYTLTSRAWFGEDVQGSAGAELVVDYVPLFQFMAFYANDLEIAPGVEMILEGRVHTNADLYLGGSGGPVRIRDNPAAGIFGAQVSARGDIYRGRKSDGACLDSGVQIDMLEDTVAPANDLDPRWMSCAGGATSIVPPEVIAQWRGAVRSAVRNIAIPSPDILDVGQGVFWQNADLRIVLNLDAPLPSFEVRDADGNIDAARTAQLAAFMNDVGFNQGGGGQGPSSVPGTYPIFYTDEPSDCADNTDVTCYEPDFSSLNRIYTSNMIGLDGPIIAAGGAPDFRRGGFFDWRENSWMRLLNVNVRDLLLWNQQNGEPFFATTDSSDDGLVLYLTVDGPSSNALNNYGVRVFGSANLPIPGGIGVVADPTGVTVASDQAFYVVGDYNRGTVNPGDLPRQPAALLGDSINVLSAGYWPQPCPDPCPANDAQSPLPLSDPLRDAATTRINAAILAGTDTTPDGAVGEYSGGFENHTRLHEDWIGKSFNYQGSLVSLGEPRHVNGRWCVGALCNIYERPQRNWRLDPAFNDAPNLPPLTPRFVYVRQAFFTEELL